MGNACQGHKRNNPVARPCLSVKCSTPQHKSPSSKGSDPHLRGETFSGCTYKTAMSPGGRHGKSTASRKDEDSSESWIGVFSKDVDAGSPEAKQSKRENEGVFLQFRCENGSPPTKDPTMSPHSGKSPNGSDSEHSEEGKFIESGNGNGSEDVTEEEKMLKRTVTPCFMVNDSTKQKKNPPRKSGSKEEESLGLDLKLGNSAASPKNLAGSKSPSKSGQMSPKGLPTKGVHPGSGKRSPKSARHKRGQKTLSQFARGAAHPEDDSVSSPASSDANTPGHNDLGTPMGPEAAGGKGQQQRKESSSFTTMSRLAQAPVDTQHVAGAEDTKDASCSKTEPTADVKRQTSLNKSASRISHNSRNAKYKSVVCKNVLKTIDRSAEKKPSTTTLSPPIGAVGAGFVEFDNAIGSDSSRDKERKGENGLSMIFNSKENGSQANPNWGNESRII